MEKKAVSFEFKANLDKREFEGYASTYERDLVGDIVQKGAYTKTIQERLPKKQIKILWQHDSAQPLGLPRYMEEDSKGLYVVGRISKTRLGDEALELINDGVVDTMSIGYDVIKDELSEDGKTRFLKELRLYEFSPVTFPANPTAAITAVRKDITTQLEELQIPQLHRLLKEGRVLSKANIAAIENAISSLQEVLKMATGKNDRADDSHSEEKSGAELFTSLLEDMRNFSLNFKK